MKKKYSNTFNSDNLLFIVPLIMALSITPLIVRLAAIPVPPENTAAFTTQTTNMIDLFTYHKGGFIIVTAIICIGILAYLFSAKKISLTFNKSYIPLYIYAILVIISTFASVNRNLSLIGYHEHYENVFILLAYIIIFIYTAVIIQDKTQLNFVINTWIVSITIMFVIGLSQFFNMDFFFTKLGNILILPSEYYGQLNQDTDAVRQVYQTLFHYNYVSFYAAIGLPFFLVLAILEKQLSKKIIFSLVVVMMVINQLISFSRNGFIGFTVSILFIAIFLRKQLFRHWKILLPVILVFFIGSTVFINSSNSIIAKRLRQGIESAFAKENHPLNSIVTLDDGIYIDHDAYKVTIKYDVATSKFVFYDTLTHTPIEEHYLSNIKRNTLGDIETNNLVFAPFKLQDIPAIEVIINNQPWHFIYNKNDYSYLTPYKNSAKLKNYETFGFEGRESFASARGYIWSRTMPLFKQYFFIGSGPDTFPLVFPQEDYVGKYNAYRTTNMIVDKPHNIYLDYAINTGLISLLMMLAFWMIYIVWSFKLYINTSFKSYYAMIGVACLTAVTGYLSSGIFNDTNQNITPVFWVLIGIGFGVNRLYSTEITKDI